VRRTYLDAGVLIAANRGKANEREKALTLLEDPNRVFLSSPFLRFELLPKTILNGNRMERQFYEKYLSNTEQEDDLSGILSVAFREASMSPVSGMDALHVAAAYLLNAEELITTEKLGKPIYRNSLVPVVGF